MKFTHKNVGLDRNARQELIEKYGRMATPTIVIGGKVFLGFKQNREEIEKIVESIIKGEL